MLLRKFETPPSTDPRDDAAFRVAETALSPSGGRLPFYLVEFAAFCADFIIIVGASMAIGAFYNFLFGLKYGQTPGQFFAIGLFVFGNFSAILVARGAYKPQALINFRRQAKSTLGAWALVFTLLLGVAFLFKITGGYSRGVILLFFAGGWCVLLFWRAALARFVSRVLESGSFAERRIIVLAEPAQLDDSELLENLKRCGFHAVRTFTINLGAIAAAPSGPAATRLLSEVVEVSRSEPVESVFLLVSWAQRRAVLELMGLLRILSLPVYLLPDKNVSYFLSNQIVPIGMNWSAELQRAPLSRAEQVVKRALDLVGATVALTVLSPLMLITALLIKLESPGPALFLQTRNGFNGRPFGIYKFRTMRVLENGATIRQATRNDPRVTAVGRILRRTSIDELPQLFNVIAGQMSLVGPRPHAVAHNSEYEQSIANYAYRYHVRPGITGWAQIHGLRGETQTLDMMIKRVEADLWYINNWSFWLDFRILLRTLALGIQPNAY